MKKNVLLKYSALLLAGSMILPVGMSAYADETPSQNATSNANIGLSALDSVPPTDPIIPDPDLGDDGQTGNTHPLRIDHASHLNFGDFSLTGQRQTISLREANTQAKPSVQVSDFRGSGAGWTLQVSTDGFFSEEDRLLRGATLTFKGTDENLESGDNSSDAPIVQEVALYAGSRPTMMHAEANTGMGTWQYLFEDVELSIPAGSLTGDYTATLVWVLSDAPHGTN